MAGQPPHLDTEAKDRIAIARLLCVLAMIYVHVPDGLSEIPVYSLNPGTLGFFLEGFLVEGPGRASAALLSVISGYLAAVALMRSGGRVTTLYRRRFLSIVVPMVFWGLVTYAVYLLVSQSRTTFLADAVTWLDKLNVVFFLTEMPSGATMHLGFLRDLFICILLSPLLLFAVKRVAWILLPLLALFYLIEHGQSGFIIILRPLILFAFTLGVWFAVRNVGLNTLDHHCSLFTVLAIVATALIMLANGGAASGLVDLFALRNLDFIETVLYPMSRLFGSLAIWTCIPLLMGGRLQSVLLKFSPYLFAAFCSHNLMLTLVYFGAWQPLFGDRESALFVFWFLSAPVTALLIAVVMVKFALVFAPPVATLITGGRVLAPVAAIEQHQPHGAELGIGVLVLKTYDAFASATGTGWRQWWAASRRLLLGRR